MIDTAQPTTDPPGPKARPQAWPKARPQASVLALYTRLARRATILLAVAASAYAALEIASYRSAYPQGVSELQFEMFADNPAVRVMNGVPQALDSAGGFAIWDAGWLLQLLLAVWAILLTTRFLRGEEDQQRADLLLSQAIGSSRVTALVLLVVAAAGLVIGSAVTVTMVVLGQQFAGSVLLGLALAGVTATFAAVAAVTSQLVEVRRRAAALAAAVIGVAYIARMVGNSADSRAWVRWVTPLGWLEQMAVYGRNNPAALLLLVGVPIALGWLAVALRARRDIGAALLSPDSARAARTRFLGGPTAFAWRANRGVLLAWVLGLAFYGAIMGALLSTMIEWIAQDEGYQRIMAQMGMAQALTLPGFLALIAVILGLAVALQVIWRIGAAHAEEEAGRLEVVLARPVTRARWLGGHVLLAALGAVLLLAALAVAIWGGAKLAGSTQMSLWDTTRAMANTAPVIALCGGLAVLAFGLAPRLTVALPVAVVIVSYVVSLLGPALKWPQAALNLSMFSHLAMVPASPWAPTSGLVMTGLGVAAAGAGILAFRRRDIASG